MHEACQPIAKGFDDIYLDSTLRPASLLSTLVLLMRNSGVVGVVVPPCRLKRNAMLSIEKCLTADAMHTSLFCPFALGFAQATTVRRSS